MLRRIGWIATVVGLIIAGMQLTACSQAPAAAADKIKPASVEPMAGTDFNRVVLTEKAAQRLGIQTAAVRGEQVNGMARKVIPYGAVLYGLNGETWIYTSPAPLTFVRLLITVDHIEGDRAVLSDGPEVGTAVATVGVAELYGTDTGIGK